jgi:hypothetical protein
LLRFGDRQRRQELRLFLDHLQRLRIQATTHTRCTQLPKPEGAAEAARVRGLGSAALHRRVDDLADVERSGGNVTALRRSGNAA